MVFISKGISCSYQWTNAPGRSSWNCETTSKTRICWIRGFKWMAWEMEKRLRYFSTFYWRGNLAKSRSKQLKPGWKDCLKSVEATSWKTFGIWTNRGVFSCIARQMSFGKREALQGRQTLKSSYDSCFHCQCNWWKGNRPNCYLEK